MILSAKFLVYFIILPLTFSIQIHHLVNIPAEHGV